MKTDDNPPSVSIKHIISMCRFLVTTPWRKKKQATAALHRGALHALGWPTLILARRRSPFSPWEEENKNHKMS